MKNGWVAGTLLEVAVVRGRVRPGATCPWV